MITRPYLPQSAQRPRYRSDWGPTYARQQEAVAAVMGSDAACNLALLPLVPCPGPFSKDFRNAAGGGGQLTSPLISSCPSL